MTYGKHGRSKYICPFSFGLALGITCAIAMFFWSVWLMKYGVPTTLTHIVPPTTYAEVWALTGWCFLKGFVFGLVLAFLYDFISCFCTARCCNKSGGCACDCGCKSCDGKKKLPRV